jgi:predicted RecA/RadA family phage recombinase
VALNRHFAEANQVSLPVEEGTESGDPIVIGELNAVALVDRQDDGEATCQLDGAFRFEVTGPFSAGDAVTAAEVGGTGSSTFGHVLEDVANGETREVPVRLSN